MNVESSTYANDHPKLRILPKSSAAKKTITGCAWLDDILNDQGKMQTLSMMFLVLLEFYRVIVSSLLIVFVPQSCHGGLCSIKQNLTPDNATYTVGLTVNFVTFAAFLLLYAVETGREHLMIKYLEVNPEALNDSTVVGQALKRLPTEHLDSIKRTEVLYKYVGTIAIVMYLANAVISGIVVFHYQLGSKTGTTFFTNILFIAMKFVDVYKTITTEDNVYLSAYLRTKVQYNDVDPDHRHSSLAQRPSDIEAQII